MRFQQNYYIACRLQDRILNTVGIEPQTKRHADPSLKAKLKPGELASLIKSWDTLEDRKRVLRNKPLPKAAEVVQKRKDRPRATFTES